MYIHPKFQKAGYGHKIIQNICNHAKILNYQTAGIGVHLKNWQAIRFWHKLGFEKLVSVHGDKEYSENTFAYIGLHKDLCHDELKM